MSKVKLQSKQTNIQTKSSATPTSTGCLTTMLEAWNLLALVCTVEHVQEERESGAHIGFLIGPHTWGPFLRAPREHQLYFL